MQLQKQTANPENHAHGISRRSLLKNFGAAGLAGLTLGINPANLFGEEPNASSLIPGKDKRLVVLTTDPAVIETPLSLLDSRITPTELLFVRNNQQPKNGASLEPLPAKNWNVVIDGLTSKTVTVSAESLEQMDQVSHEMVLQCSGNSRSLYAQTVKSKGTQWGRGAMGNVVFGGVPLSKVLEANGVKVNPKAKFVTVDGRDLPPEGKEDFQHSLPADEVLNNSILAVTLNGQPIPAIHGGPVRLITPGIYGTMQLKWVSGLTFATDEITNYNHIPRYRVPNTPIKPGTPIEYTLSNSSYNWAMKVKSVVLSPEPDTNVKAGKVTVKGVAFNDGKAPIEAVLVSINKGETWWRAKLETNKNPYGWVRFELPVSLDPGRHSLWTRAVDTLGRSQPIDGSIAWNPSGYEWNGVEKIDVVVK